MVEECLGKSRCQVRAFFPLSEVHGLLVLNETCMNSTHFYGSLQGEVFHSLLRWSCYSFSCRSELGWYPLSQFSSHHKSMLVLILFAPAGFPQNLKFSRSAALKESLLSPIKAIHFNKIKDSFWNLLCIYSKGKFHFLPWKTVSQTLGRVSRRRKSREERFWLSLSLAFSQISSSTLIYLPVKTFYKELWFQHPLSSYLLLVQRASWLHFIHSCFKRFHYLWLPVLFSLFLFLECWSHRLFRNRGWSWLVYVWCRLGMAV